MRRSNGDGTIRGGGASGFYVCTIYKNGRRYYGRGIDSSQALYNAKKNIDDVAQQAWYFRVLKKRRKDGVVFLKGELLTIEEYLKSGLMADEVEAVMVHKEDMYMFGKVKVQKDTVDTLLAKSMRVGIDEAKGA